MRQIEAAELMNTASNYTSTYAKGGSNSVSINSFGCAGLSQDAQGDFARVTATYMSRRSSSSSS
jgi:hypothetical protein